MIASTLLLLSPLLFAQIGFEELPAGPLLELETPAGTWTAAAGHAEIDPKHARGGTQCLHLFGGEQRSVVLELERTDLHTVSFWAERWTRRAPFEFTVEASARGRWQEVYDGSEEIAVGGFDTLVRFDVADGTKRLRFTCMSPEGSGILIDDLRLEEAKPMKLVSVTCRQPVLPVLVGNRQNPVLCIDLEVDGNQDPLVLTEVVFDLEGTTPGVSPLASVALYRGKGDGALDYRDPDHVFAEEDRFGASLELWSGRPGERLAPFAEDRIVRGQLELEPGLNRLWISVTPNKYANLDWQVDAACLRVAFADGTEAVPEVQRPDGARRLGVALRTHGSDIAYAYRIPGLATTTKGTLIAVYDVRWRGWGDLPGDIDVGMSRSTDGGRRWEPMSVVLDMGSDPQWQYDGIGDPAVLVDRVRGTIWVIATWSHGDRSWRGSGPGLEPEETGQLILTRSDDDGESWSKPINITKQVKDPAWCFLLQGPGRGITMGDGTLVFPAQFQLSPEEQRMPHSSVIWSGDHGKTWNMGTGAKPNTTESAVVELQDGVLMLNMRDNRGGSRSVYTSEDLGASWSEHSTSRGALPEPVCMASLIHVGRELSGEADGRLLFSNPAVSRPPRREMTIKYSPDFGTTWPEANQLLLDEGNSAGYSCLTMIDEETIGILYEGSRAHLTFQRIPLSELTGE